MSAIFCATCGEVFATWDLMATHSRECTPEVPSAAKYPRMDTSNAPLVELRERLGATIKKDTLIRARGEFTDDDSKMDTEGGAYAANALEGRSRPPLRRFTGGKLDIAAANARGRDTPKTGRRTFLVDTDVDTDADTEEDTAVDTNERAGPSRKRTLDFTTPKGAPGPGVDSRTPAAPKKPKAPRRIIIKPDHMAALTEGPNPPADLLRGKPEAEQEMLRKNWVSLKSYSHKSKIQSVFNLRLTDRDVVPRLDAIFRDQKGAFKVNASLGSMLRNKNTGELRYYHSSINNARMFEEPFQIQGPEDFQKFVDEIKSVDFNENPNVDKESSEWVTHDITNISIYVNHLDHSIRVNNSKTSRHKCGTVTIASAHNQCFFACLAAHLNPDQLKRYLNRETGCLRLKRQTMTLYEQYTSLPAHEFAGTTIEEMDALEHKFRIGIQVYTLEKRQEKTVATLIRRANPNYTDRMVLDLSELSDGEYHFALIHDLAKYSYTFQCGKCGQLWPKSWFCDRHAATCDTTTDESYPSGHFKIPLTVFEKMEKVGVSVPEAKRYFPYFITYDFEAYMIDSDHFEKEHVPMSWSTCSNIPGLTEPVFRADRCPDILIKAFSRFDKRLERPVL